MTEAQPEQSAATEAPEESVAMTEEVPGGIGELRAGIAPPAETPSGPAEP